MGELADALSGLNGNSGPNPSPSSSSPEGGELFSAIHDLRQSDATGNLVAAQGANPDNAARALAISQQLGVPQPVVEADLPTFEGYLKLQKNRQTMGQNPALQTMAADNPLAARIAQDDFEHLDFLSKLTSALSSGNQQAQLSDELSMINTRQMMHVAQPEDAQRSQEIQQQLQNAPQYPEAWGYLQQATGFGAGLVKSAARVFPGALAYGLAVGSATEGAGAIPAFAAAMGKGIAADYARQSAANTYAKLSMLQTTDGKPLSEPVKYFGSALAGTIAFYAGSTGGEEVNQTTMAGINSLINQTLEQAATRPTIMNAFGNLSGTIAKSGLTGAAINGMMTSANVIGEQAARLLTPNMKTILTDPAQQAEFSAQLVNSMEEGAELFPLMELPGASLRFIGDNLRARQAGIDAQALSDLAQGVAQSKTRNRSVQTFIDFMRGQTEGTPGENLHINQDAVMQLYQRAGVFDPAALPPDKDPFLGWLPDRDQQIREARETGGNIVVPTADFVSRLAGSDAFNELLPDITVRQDGVTLREAQDVGGMLARTKEFMEATQKLSENRAKGMEEDEPMQRVYNAIYPQVVDAGYDQRTADMYARTMAAQAATMAEREPGIYSDAWDAWSRGMLRVQGPGQEGEGAAENLPLRQYAGENAQGWPEAQGKFSSLYDGMPRFEVSDAAATFKPLSEWGTGGATGAWSKEHITLGDILDHPQLFEQYPEIKNVPVRFSVFTGAPESGSFRRNGIEIKAPDMDAAKKVMLHEIQHWIQDKEGFARGSSPEEFKRQYVELDSRVSEINDRIHSIYKEAPKDSRGNLIDPTEYDALLNERAKIVSELQKLQDAHGMVGYEPYRKTAGEIEARDTAARASMSRWGRRRTPPYSSEDIAPEDAILLQSNLFGRAREIGRRITGELKAWGQKVDDFLEGNLKSSKPLEVGTTPEVLRQVGAKELPLTITPRVMAKIMGSEEGQHGIDPEIVKALPSMLAEPLAVFRSGTVANALTVLTEGKDTDGNPVLVAIHLNVRKEHLEVNELASAYGKQNIEGWAKKQAFERNVLYLDKKKIAAVQRSGGLQLPKELYSGGKGKIATEADIVKPFFEQKRSARSIPSSESLSENPISTSDIQDYEQLQKEAARRAWEQVEKEHGKQVRISEKALREEGAQLYDELSTSRVLEAVRKGGISRESLNDQDQEPVITPLVRKYPGLIRKGGLSEIDVLAHDHGYETTDALVQDLLKAPGKKEFLDQYVEDAKERMGAELGLSPEEWQRRLIEKEQEIFRELTKSVPDARLERIRNQMNANASLQLPAGGFGTGPHVMNIFAIKDRSSFLHEAGHLFLEQLIYNAAHPEASEGSRADLATLKAWWENHAEEMHDQFQRARREAEAAVRANPEDDSAWARVAAYRKAAKLLGDSPESGVEFFKGFAGHLGREMEDPTVRTALMTPLHELFARTFEAYLMEGKAPSPGLAPVFDSFRTWLKRVYERVAGRGRALLGLSQVAGTPIEVSPEVRGVMDRMLATDEQIEVMRQQQRLGKLFKDAKQAGMTSAEWKAYNSLMAKAVDEARLQTQKKAMAAVAKEKSEEWEKKSDELRPEVEQQTNSRKDIQALHYLRRGKLLGEEDAGENRAPLRMNRDGIVSLIGQDGLSKLPYGLYKVEGGFDPQEIAETIGYRSGSQMLTDLISLEAQRRDLAAKGVRVGSEEGYRQYLVKEALTQRLREHFGDPLTTGTLPEDALDALHNDKSMQVLATELRALIRQSGKARPVFGPAADARAWAREAIGDRKLWEVQNLNRYARDESRAAMSAEQAMVKGDFEAAIKAKREQILNHALYMEAKKASESLEGLEDRANRFAKKRSIASMDQGALDQIHTLLERFGLKAPDPAATGRRVLSDWIGEQQAMGADIIVPDSLFNPTLPKHYKDLTVSQMRDLSDAIKSLAHVGRQLKKITIAGEKADFDATVEDLVRTAYDNVKPKEIPRERNPEMVQGDFGQKAKARWFNAKTGLGSFHASLAGLEQELFDRLDGKDSNGPWNSVIFRRIKEARAYENHWREQMAQGIRDLQKDYPKEEQDKLSQMLPEMKELIDNKTGEPTVISKAQLLSLALNWGNESNRSKMCRGEGWSPEAVQEVFDRHMSKSDWDFVQGIWDLIDRLRPEIKARELRMTGVEPIWIDASSVTTPFGEYRGGYYPMVYDPARSGDVMDRLIDNAAKMMDQGKAGRPATDKGYTMARMERYSRPVKLSLDVLPQHIDTVVRDLAWRETVYDLCRVFKNQGVREAINGTLGQPMYDQIIPWLKRTIGDRPYDVTGNDFWAGMARKLRLNVTMMGLGYRLSTMLIHGATAGSFSVGEIGARWTAHGFREFYGTPEKMARMRDFIFDHSPEMAHRMETIDRDVRDGLRSMLDRDGVIAGAKRYAYYGISMLDMASAMPTWLGAYEKATAPEAEGGLGMKNESDAAYYADKSVRNAHGSGNAEDLAAVQFGSEFQKLTTMFYTFWNRFYNRQVDIARSGIGALKEGNVPDFAAVLARSWWYFVMPMIAHAVIKGGGPDDDESWTGWAARELGLTLFSGIPMARDIANWKLGGHQYRPTPVVSAIETAGQAWSDAKKVTEGDDPSKYWLRHALDTAGYTWGLPLGQADQSAQYLWDYWNGDQDPEDVAQFVRGVVMGAHRKK